MLVKASLAFADLLSMILVFILCIMEFVQVSDPYVMISVREGERDEVEYCTKKSINEIIRHINNFVINASVSVSFYTITVMSLLKVYALASPISYKFLSKKNFFYYYSCMGYSYWYCCGFDSRFIYHGYSLCFPR